MITRDRRTNLRDTFHAIDFEMKNIFFPNWRLENFACTWLVLPIDAEQLKWTAVNLKFSIELAHFSAEKKNYHLILCNKCLK